MAKNDTRVTDNPKLMQKQLSDGNYSLYLDYYLGRVNVKDEVTGEIKSKVQRRREFLKLTVLANPRTPIERQQNKETFEIARKIRFECEQKMKESLNGYRLKKDNTINFLTYFQAYIDSYTKKDIRMVQIALQRFRDFLSETKEYSKFTLSIKPEQLTKDMMLDFVEYLQSKSTGEGAKSIYQRFKKVIKYAIEHDVMIKNPCTGVVCKVDDQILRKDILSFDEIQALINTHYDNENPNVRRAFIFCLYCGLRFCDVKDLTYRSVDYSNKRLTFEQNKTKGHSAASGVVIPLNDGLLSLIGEPSTDESKDGSIFNLPSYESCLKSLKRWVKRAGIDKHISWHCARHRESFNYVYSSILQSCICRQVTI